MPPIISSRHARRELGNLSPMDLSRRAAALGLPRGHRGREGRQLSIDEMVKMFVLADLLTLGFPIRGASNLAKGVSDEMIQQASRARQRLWLALRLDAQDRVVAAVVTDSQLHRAADAQRIEDAGRQIIALDLTRAVQRAEAIARGSST